MERQPGTIVNGRYLIERFLGSGAMGAVYLARDHLMESPVAMKCLVWRPNRSAALQSFKTEFATLTTVYHPHITPVFDFGQDEVTHDYFFTSEYVDGTDFYQATATASAGEVVQLMVQTLQALAFLHQQQIYHFDIKPQNILVARTDEGSRIKLIDFGLSAVGPRNQLVGTPSYMAPEMIQRDHPDHRADLYSLGVLCYFALARHNPFRGNTREETFANQLKLRPPRLRATRSDVPEWLETIIARLLAKRPEERFPSAAAVLEALAHQGIPTTSPRTAPEAMVWESRFVGHETEREHVTTALESLLHDSEAAPMLIWVRGQPGSGRSRFLREIKFAAQLQGYATHTFDRTDIAARLHWLAALDTTREDPGAPTLFFLDDADTLIGTHAADEIVAGVRELLQSSRQQRAIGVHAPIAVIVSSDEDREGCQRIAQTFVLPTEEILLQRLGPLTIGECERLVQGVLGTSLAPAAAQQLHQHTDGNPLFLMQILRHLAAQDTSGSSPNALTADTLAAVPIPKTIEECIVAAYRELAPEAQAVFAALAILGDPLTRVELSGFAQRDVPVTVLTALVQHGFASYDPLGREYSIRSQTKARVVVETLAPDERRQWHDRTAAWLTADGVTSVDRIFFHQARGTQPDRPELVLWELAREQLAQGTERDAIATLQQLLATEAFPAHSSGDVECRLLLAGAYRDAGAFGAAEAIYRGLQADLSEDERQRLRLLRVYEDLGTTAMLKADWLAAAAALRLAHALLTDATEERLHTVRVENLRATVEWRRGQFAAAAAIFEQTMLTAAQLPVDEQRLITNNLLGEVYLAQGRHDEALTWTAAAQTRYQQSGQLRSVARMAWLHGRILRAKGELRTARTQLETAYQQGQATKDAPLLAEISEGLGELLLERQEYGAALGWFERALSHLDRQAPPVQSIRLHVGAGTAARHFGKTDKALDHWLTGLAMLLTIDPNQSRDGLAFKARLHAGIADLADTRGETERAAYHRAAATQSHG